jgi:Asp-tRNA(Asn)/Glu-tRNA(Gln) amidotransferase C subunit
MTNPIIDITTIKKVGDLSRIFSNKFSDDNPDILAKYVPSLVGVMDYIDNLCSIDANNYSPFDSIKKVGINDLRADTPDTSETYDRVRQNILSGFPARQGDFLQLPIRIIHDS